VGRLLGGVAIELFVERMVRGEAIIHIGG
jgi:hypothetical protein